MVGSPSEETAYLLAVRYLNFRPRSIKEIHDYLLKKQVPSEIITSVTNKLVQQKFLNDEEFAKMWIRTRIALKPLSQRVLRMELVEKGIPKQIIDEALTEQQEVSGSDFEMARLLAQKKQSKYQGMSKNEVYTKLGGFLGRKGFSYDIIKRVIDELFTF